MEKGLKINARFAGEGSEGSARRKRAGSKGSEGLKEKVLKIDARFAGEGSQV